MASGAVDTIGRELPKKARDRFASQEIVGLRDQRSLLGLDMRLGHPQIAHSCSIGLGTVREYLQNPESVWSVAVWEGSGEDRPEPTLFGGLP